jgi:hypothetical protein
MCLLYDVTGRSISIYFLYGSLKLGRMAGATDWEMLFAKSDPGDLGSVHKSVVTTKALKNRQTRLPPPSPSDPNFHSFHSFSDLAQIYTV